MSENRHGPDEARENETRPDGVDDALRTERIDAAPAAEGVADRQDVTEAIEDGPAGRVAEQTGSPARSVPETERIEVAQGVSDPGSSNGGQGTLPAAGAPYGDAPYAPPGTPVQAVPHPNVAPQPAPPQGPRVGTVVWGLVVLAIGLGVLAASAGARIDVSLAAILLLGGAGVALVAGSIVSSFRRRNEH